jgi:hypothetical protein
MNDDAATAEQARGLARSIAAYWQDALSERLLGVYLLGSLAHGGFSARYSDVDFGLITTNGVVQRQSPVGRALRRARQGLRGSSPLALR